MSSAIFASTATLILRIIHRMKKHALIYGAIVGTFVYVTEQGSDTIAHFVADATGYNWKYVHAVENLFFGLVALVLFFWMDYSHSLAVKKRLFVVEKLYHNLNNLLQQVSFGIKAKLPGWEARIESIVQEMASVVRSIGSDIENLPNGIGQHHR